MQTAPEKPLVRAARGKGTGDEGAAAAWITDWDHCWLLCGGGVLAGGKLASLIQ